MPIDNIREPSIPLRSAREQGEKRGDEKKLEKACMDFESLFLLQMLKSMRKTIPKTGFLGEGQEKQIFESLFDEELSKNIAKRGGLGLGKILYKQMVKEREGPSSFSAGPKLFGPDDSIPGPLKRE